MTVDGGSLGLWQALVPAAGTNYITNPSFEIGTTGWATSSSTLTRVAGGRFGAWMGRMLASATNGAITSGTQLPQSAGGTNVTASAWVKASSPLVAFRIAFGASVTDQAHPGDGEWHRLEVTRAATGAVTPTIQIYDARTSGWTNVDIDGVQYETGVAVASTYCDGDQDGCSWTAGAHASTSTRVALDGRGGALASFDAAGVSIKDMAGIGTAPMDVATQALAIADGETYQRSTVKSRVITLTALLEGDGTTAGLHTTRRAALSLVNPDSRSGRGPVTLRYTGSAVVKRLRAYYEGGLEWGRIDGATEDVPLRFVAPDPFFEAEVDAQAALVTNVVTSVAGTTGGILQRDPSTGAWSTMNGGITGVNAGSAVNVMKLGPDGSLYVGGIFAGPASGGSTPRFFAKWNTTTQTWASLTGGDPNGTVTAIAISPGGEIAIGGAFTAVGAIANTNRIALYNGTTWTALGTGANGDVTGLAYDQNGLLWAIGTFTTIGGVTAPGAAYWDTSTWTALGAQAGLANLQLGPDGLMYANAGSGVYAYISSAWTSIGAATGGSVFSIQWTPRGLYAMGTFTAIGGIAAAGAARWNGAVWEAIATTVAPTQSFVGASLAPDGTLLTMGNYTTSLYIDGSYLPWDLAAYDGSTWSGYDVIVGANANGIIALAHPNGTLTLSYSASSGAADTRVLPGVTSLTNGGTAQAYPVVRFGSGAGAIYSLLNLTTGAALRFNNLVKYAGETVTLDLRPGRMRLTATSGRELLRYVLGGSDLDTFTLVPGTNVIQAFTSPGITSADLFYRPRYMSAD